MAELLVLVQDLGAPGDAASLARRPQRGDVLAVERDGFRWGTQELAHARYRILRLPGVDPTSVAKWLEREQWTAADLLLPEEARPELARRVRRLNVDAVLLPAAFKAWLADNTRAEPIREVAVGGEALLDLVEVAVGRLRDRLAARVR